MKNYVLYHLSIAVKVRWAGHVARDGLCIRKPVDEWWTVMDVSMRSVKKKLKM